MRNKRNFTHHKILPLMPWLLSLMVLLTSQALGHEFSGYVAAEGRLFLENPIFREQEKNNASISFQPEYYHEWEGGSSFTFVPFARIDSADNERSHVDIRELNVLWLGDTWELRVGIGKVFWGVLEFVHLVDVINQTDLVESIDGEDKLGQPMINLTLPRDWGVMDLFVLPYFRERTFPGSDGRLRTSPVVDTDKALYGNDDKEQHIDFAIRYSHSLGNLDFGIYQFMGTGREPTLLSDFNESGLPVLIPFYEQVNQTGVDLQLVSGEWLWKLEALYRTGQGEDFFAVAGGFEYTFVGISDTHADLGVISEFAYDSRDDEATTVFENDVMLGLRVTVNDAAGTVLLVGMSQDIKSHSNNISVETSRRIGNNIKVTLEAYAFLNPSEDDPFFSLRNDDFFRLEVAYYF